MIRALPLALAALTLFVQRTQTPTFRSETRLVVLQATVRDQHGVLVPNLPEGAFTVFENGTRQSVAFFRREDVAVSVGLLLDNSGSMRTIRPQVERAAAAFAGASNPQDELFLVDFADKASVDVPMTSDTRSFAAGLHPIDAIGGTALWDALQLAESYVMRKGTRDRKVLVVITDGNDNASDATLAQVEHRLDAGDTVVYAVGLFGAHAQDHRGRQELDRITQRTGGAAYYPSTIDEIDATALAIAAQIRQQYTLGYSPINPVLDGRYRSIRVEARGPGKLTVKTRPGYLAEPRSHPPAQ